MISYRTRTLDNGLRVLAHRDPNTCMAAVNILYCVGARNENPDHTGFAHLFEHLMFRGTKQVPDFDLPLQMACGENNAFTNNDYTDYYITLPQDNIETALWLEADRMTELDISPDALQTEKNVVIEEFNQRYLNQPYGDMWMLLRGMVYKVHPYRWATIGLTPDHIRSATIEDVRRFYKRYYRPSNAILSVASALDEQRVFDLADKWFSDIEDTPATADAIADEPPQTSARRMEVRRNVPATAITIALRMGRRLSRNYYLCDMMTDLLAGGTSARLYRELVRNRRLFSGVNAYITGDLDEGMLIVTGNLLPGTPVETGEAALWEQLHELCDKPVSEYEIQKIKNKFEAELTFGETNIMNKAMNLGYYAMTGDLPLINRENEIFSSITPEQIMEEAKKMFLPEKSSTLIYACE